MGCTEGSRRGPPPSLPNLLSTRPPAMVAPGNGQREAVELTPGPVTLGVGGGKGEGGGGLMTRGYYYLYSPPVSPRLSLFPLLSHSPVSVLDNPCRYFYHLCLSSSLSVTCSFCLCCITVAHFPSLFCVTMHQLISHFISLY